ncbi:hypothetical protein [Amnibacterium kyonggiense]|uniref:LysM domain-containing protein n=1 Tax=Amnibacterium kyonggiense TaxID=595671 RepID=A0A4R7FRA0_9MICO|nr:hypothetical protein [Amnibacterium kyonggiense]TDS80169.1 hypothetical protein CLV52_0723 [Amnibacterium kyonggiense]
MATDPADREALRQRLYRPGVSPDDLAAYLGVAEATTIDPAGSPAVVAPAGERGPSLRPFVIGGLGVLVVAAFGGALLVGGRAAPEQASVSTPAPTAAVDTGRPDGDQGWFVTFGTEPVFDGGERDRARGAAVAEGPDMVRYTVASGDTVGAVAQRFSLCLSDVLLALPYGAAQAAMPPDQTLELSRSSTRTPPDC